MFTSDIIENRLLLAALITMERIPHRSANTKRELSRAQRLFGAVRRVQFRSAAVPDVVFTRLNHHYQSVVTLARILLRSASLDLGGGGVRGSAFLVDMNVVFEEFVRTALREALDASHARFPNRPPLLFLDTADVVPLRPDLCLVTDRRVVWVGDVKYKRLPAAAYRNADLYQLLAYSVALDLEGVRSSTLPTRVSAPEHVMHDHKRLHVIALDLSVPPTNILLQIERIAGRIVSQSRPAAA